MSLKFKISILHIIVSFVTLLFIYMIYDSYVVSQQKDVEKQLMRVLKLNQNHMEKSLLEINNLLESKKQVTQKIHLTIHHELRSEANLKLDYLRQKVRKDFDLNRKKLDLEVFIIDNSYKIVDTTHKKNLNLDLKKSEKSKVSLDSLNNTDEYNRSNDVFVDFLDYEMKSFSYSKLNENYFLGIGIIYKEVGKQKEAFDEMIEIANTNMDMFCIMKDSQGNEYYESLVAHKKKFKSNEEYLKSKELFPININSDDLIINASRTWEMQNEKVENLLKIYIPLVKEKNPHMGIPGNIVLKVEFDISEENLFFDTIFNKLVLFILIHFVLIFLIYYFTTKYQKIEKKLNLQITKNIELVAYNKKFISNMVHQIRTPLAVIMTNISILEIFVNQNAQKFITQITASINLLTNSYENLSYFISFNSLQYHKRRIDFSEFLKERLEFFDQIAKANKMNIISSIKEDLYVQINDIELQRILDNSITIAIIGGDFNENIIVSLRKKDDTVELEIKVMSKNTKDKLFDKSKQDAIKDTSSLSLGVYLIKKICLKNSISYNYLYDKKSFTLKYSF